MSESIRLLGQLANNVPSDFYLTHITSSMAFLLVGWEDNTNALKAYILTHIDRMTTEFQRISIFSVISMVLAQVKGIPISV